MVALPAAAGTNVTDGNFLSVAYDCTTGTARFAAQATNDNNISVELYVTIVSSLAKSVSSFLVLLDGTPIIVPIDADGNGWDDFLIVDTLIADFNGDGVDEYCVGIYLGTSCNLVYVPLDGVRISQSSEALDEFISEANGEA